jgi:3-hydroxyisobutyrate dehydrogenase
MRVGIIGLGRMGGAMAQRLIERGHEVLGWNRTIERAEGIAGLTVSPSPAALAGAAEFIILMLYDEHAADAVYHGADGVLTVPLVGKTVIDMSTVRPNVMTQAEADVTGRGGLFAACPVSGTVGPARNGTLLGLLGGSSQARERVKPLLADLCDRLQEFDEPGAASAMKLAVNLPLLAFFQALGEAALVVRRFGIPPERFVEIVSNSPGAPPALKMRAAGVLAAMRGEVSADPAFTLSTVEKDLRLVDEEGEYVGYTLPVTKAVRAMVHEAVREGWEGRDLAALPAFDLRA